MKRSAGWRSKSARVRSPGFCYTPDTLSMQRDLGNKGVMLGELKASAKTSEPAHEVK